MDWKSLKSEIESIDEIDRQQLQLINQLINRRTELGMSQRDLALEAKVAQSTIARMEVRLVVPSVPTLIKITSALGLDIALSPQPKEKVSI